MDTFVILFLLVNIVYAVYRKYPHLVVGGMNGAWQVLTFPFHLVALVLGIEPQHHRRRRRRNSEAHRFFKPEDKKNGKGKLMTNEDVKALGLGILDRTINDPRTMLCSVRQVRDGLLFSYRNGKSELLSIDGWKDVTGDYVMFQPRNGNHQNQPY